MAASLAKHALWIPRRNFGYFTRLSGCHVLKNCDETQKCSLYGYRYVSSSMTFHSREDHRVYDESTSDSSADTSKPSCKVDHLDRKPSSQRAKNKFELLQTRMREKYNLPNDEQIQKYNQEDSSDVHASVVESASDRDNDDFFGVLSESVSTNSRRKVQDRSFDEVAKRHPYLKRKPVRNTVKVYETSFGYMTLDSDIKNNMDASQENNRESKDTARESDKMFEGHSYIENQYFEDIDKYSSNSKVDNEKSSNEPADIVTGKGFIEEQYFASSPDAVFLPWEQRSLNNMTASDSIASAELFTHDDAKPTANSSGEHSELNIHDDLKYDSEPVKGSKSLFHEKSVYHGRPVTASNETSNYHIVDNNARTHKDIFEEQYFGGYEDAGRDYEDAGRDVINEYSKPLDSLPNLPNQLYPQEATVLRDRLGKSNGSYPDTIFIDTKTRLEEKASSVKRDLDKPKSAFDEAMKIRQELRGKKKAEPTEMKDVHPKLQKWRGETDSKGFRKLKNQVLDLQKLPEEVVVNILKESILYETEEMLALYKPYGLPSHGGPGVHHSIGKLLPKLGKRLDKQVKDLQLVHRLDKETTGVMVLAKTDEMSWKLHSMFKKRQVLKKYWVLTKGVPTLPEGVIDIPMGETEVDGYHRMTLRPDYTKDTKLYMTTANKVKKQEAVTNYKVLDSKNSVALVECIPETGVKHQIRCHLAFGLNTPIIGDHKYSHVSKVAPQKLYPETLQKLSIRQATVRYVPMHLHAKALVFPELLNGRNVFISARLPKYFMQNMKWLGLNIPE